MRQHRALRAAPRCRRCRAARRGRRRRAGGRPVPAGLPGASAGRCARRRARAARRRRPATRSRTRSVPMSTAAPESASTCRSSRAVKPGLTGTATSPARRAAEVADHEVRACCGRRDGRPGRGRALPLRGRSGRRERRSRRAGGGGRPRCVQFGPGQGVSRQCSAGRSPRSAAARRSRSARFGAELSAASCTVAESGTAAAGPSTGHARAAPGTVFGAGCHRRAITPPRHGRRRPGRRRTRPATRRRSNVRPGLSTPDQLPAKVNRTRRTTGPPRCDGAGNTSALCNGLATRG